MDEANVSFGQMAAASKRFVRRLFTIGENRIELLTVELQEERERLFRALFLILGIAAFSLLATISLSGVILLLLWPYSPLLAFLGLTALYVVGGLLCLLRFKALQRNWNSFSATLNELKKDRECLEKSIE